jgi:RNA polymerase sigma factor (sigma-70 family)
MLLFFIIDGENDSPEQKLNNICEKYYLDIHRYCASRAGILYADDITGEVFELFCKKYRAIKHENYLAWLYKTADNLVKNFHKKQKRKMQKEKYIDESLSELLSYNQNFETAGDHEIEKYKNEIIETLSDQDWLLFDMKYIEKLSISQISAKLSISGNNVKQRLFRLREKIKAEAAKKFL